MSKLSFSAFTVEPSSNDNSYFSKYLDEILYFFETSEANVVFIEDIDRFNSLEVFEHLRELNYLINNSRQIRGPVKFVYAIKDSIFQIESSDKAMKESSEYVRTKFFDFILPIIPVVDSNNSSEFLLPKMRGILGVNLDGSINSKPLDIKMEQFLLDISIYVDDLRLLYNICNEFRIYKDNLKKRLKNLEHIDDKKLLSIIVYKNIMPKDFAQLQSKKGNLYRIFHEGKDELLYDLREKLKQKKLGLEKKLVDSDRDTFHRAAAAISGLISQKVQPHYFNTGYLKRTERGQSGSAIPYFPINEVTVRDFLDFSHEILYYTGNTWNAFPRDEIRNQFYLVGLNDDFSYEEIAENERTKILTQLEAIKKELAFLQTKQMKDLVNLNDSFNLNYSYHTKS